MSTSSHFWDSFSGVGSIVMECCCGRTHFVSAGDFEEGELEELQARAGRNSVLYVEHPEVDYISGIDLSITGTIVYGCTCGAAEKVESFLLDNRDDILTFYRKVLESEQNRASRLRQGLEGAAR